MTFAFSPPKRTLVIIFLAVTALIFLLSTQAMATMFGLFKKYDVHLSPEVHGVITKEGKPVVGLTVFRGLTYGDDKELVDKTSTDNEGRFSFEEKNIRSRKPGSMFDESSIRQTIDVDYQGEKYILWYTEAIGIEPNKALTERLAKLYCDLNNSQDEFEFNSYEYPQAGYLVHSICRW
ncbi:DUF4198 domain-containing protein [Colwellia sp. E2M01]|uniref:DUF4198 domain-containing protein n=1 Tax=Colwellia sp. E2M01 TaxID=2841561 RepID=UPI001C084EBA|nr:DUF4198 domain-containing protein [Colwellia sp. E2M01]MBU2870476.1 DUF4198 domain-containing protein [Colwellia sp. E2M01]